MDSKRTWQRRLGHYWEGGVRIILFLWACRIMVFHLINIYLTRFAKEAFLNIGMVKGKHVLAFCNAADTINRNHFTLRISFNEGITWKKNILFDKSGDDTGKDFTA